MELWHRIVFRDDPVERLTYEAAGLTAPAAKMQGEFVVLEVADNDPRWALIKGAVEHFKPLHTVAARFDRGDFKHAEYFELCGPGGRFYPASDYETATYDCSTECKQCGVYRVQRAPFRFTQHMEWKRNVVVGLGWVHDEFFIRRDVYDSFFVPLGIGCWPVIRNRQGELSDSTVQLRIEETVDVDYDSPRFEICGACGHKKYNIPVDTLMPRPRVRPDSPVFRSSSFFGSGGRAIRLTFVTRAVYLAMTKPKLPGFSFVPCAPAGFSFTG